MQGDPVTGAGAAATAPAVRADSDVGRLTRVLVHRPGLELAGLTTAGAEEMLFDGPVSVVRAREEHDAFVRALRSAGVEVLYVADLLAEVFAAEGDAPAPRRRAAQAIAGLADGEAEPGGRFRRLSGGPWRLPPLPNLMFTRDPMTVVGDGLHVGRPARLARREELRVARRLARHPALGAARRWSDGDVDVEGGDVLLAGDGVVVVGVGPRTTPAAVRRLARRLFAGGAAREVLAAVLPEGPFHLDLALTIVARDTVLVDRHVIDRTSAVVLRPGHPPRAAGPLLEEMARALGLPRLREIRATASRHGRSWDLGANVLALDEGLVVAYADNAAANTRLRRAGVEVLEAPGAALGMGRGGPRCLSCPLVREPLEPS